MEKSLRISHMTEAKEVDEIKKEEMEKKKKKEEMVREQRRMKKKHLENPTLRGSAEDKGPGRRSTGRIEERTSRAQLRRPKEECGNRACKPKMAEVY